MSATKQHLSPRNWPSGAGALAGVRVLDFTRVLAGPYCTLALRDLGAEIIKIENPAGGDDTRRFRPPEIGGESTYFLHVNRGKESVALDLAQPEGRDAALALAREADVLVENFRPGVMQRLGLDYETIAADNPRLVYCSVSGYGGDGPLAGRAGLDPVIQAECGLMALTGEPDGRPMRIGVSLVDAMTGIFAGQSVLAALLARERSGRGQRVEVSLFDTGVNMLMNFAGAYLMAGVVPRRAGNGNLVSQPAGVYQAGDEPFLLTVAGDRIFERLCREVLDAPELSRDPRFRSNSDRLAHVTELDSSLNAIFAHASRSEWIDRLRAAGIPAGEIRTLPEALESEELALSGLLASVAHPTAGELPVLRSPMRLHGTPGPAPGPAPLLGEHTESVLARVAGYDEAMIAALRAKGVIPRREGEG